MNLKEIRIKKNMTQQELADKIGKDRSLIAKIENENTFPSIKTAKALGKVLGVSWTIFFNNIGENNSHKFKSENKKVI